METQKKTTTVETQASEGVSLFNKAYHSYSKRQNETAKEYQAKADKAYTQYCAALQEAMNATDYAAKVMEAQNTYLRTQVDLREAVTKQNREAYNDYVKDIKHAWGQVELKHFDAMSMAAASQGIWMVACHADTFVI